MKERIIPVCLACMMLVSMCKRDTGGVQGVINPDKSSLKSSKKVRNIKSDASAVSAVYNANKKRKPGGLLVKPRVDVPDVK
jgi:hypothetical protein